jgi:hypothetical protein
MQEAEIGRVKIPGQIRQKKVYETLSQQKKVGNGGTHLSS